MDDDRIAVHPGLYDCFATTLSKKQRAEIEKAYGKTALNLNIKLTMTIDGKALAEKTKSRQEALNQQA